MRPVPGVQVARAAGAGRYRAGRPVLAGTGQAGTGQAGTGQAGRCSSSRPAGHRHTHVCCATDRRSSGNPRGVAPRPGPLTGRLCGRAITYGFWRRSVRGLALKRPKEPLSASLPAFWPARGWLYPVADYKPSGGFWALGVKHTPSYIVRAKGPNDKRLIFYKRAQRALA